MTKLWKRWKKIAEKIAGFQASIVLTIVYIFIIFPLGIIIRVFFKENLKKHIAKNNSSFVKRKYFKQDLEWAKKQ